MLIYYCKPNRWLCAFKYLTQTIAQKYPSMILLWQPYKCYKGLLILHFQFFLMISVAFCLTFAETDIVRVGP